MPNNCNMTMEAIPNEIPINCDMATNLILITIQNDQWAYQIVYLNGITRDSQDNYQEMITEIPAGQISQPKWTSHADWMRGLLGALPYEATDRDAHKMAYWRIKRLLSTKKTPKLLSKWLSVRSVPPRPYQMQNQEIPESAYAKRLSESSSAPITVSMTAYREAYVLYMDQWCTAHPNAIDAFYLPQMATS